MHRARLARRSSYRHSPVVAPKVETKRESYTLRFQCQNTGREVDSRISAHSGARLISIRIQCPICESLHEWQVANESLGTASNGARLAGAQNKPHDFQYPSPEIIELREQLLDEFNHRLKNNLQILYGFLQIARSKTDNPK